MGPTSFILTLALCSAVVLAVPAPEPSPNPNPEPSPNPNPEPSPNPNPEPSPNPNPEPSPNPNPEPSPNPNPNPEPNPNPAPNPEPSPNPSPNPAPNPEPSPNPAPNPDPSPNPEPFPNPDPNPDPSPNPDPEANPGLVDALLELVVDLALEGGLGSICDGSSCYDVDTIDYSLNDAYCDQPLFVNFLTKTDSHCLIDNICYTYFPLPDDPQTFNLYRSTVFCDGSYRIQSTVVTDLSIGRLRGADPYCTYTSSVIGYAGCDTFIVYRCFDYGECTQSYGTYVFGISPSCAPLGLSCIQKVEEIVCDAGLPKSEYIVLPMKLPNRCVTEQLCINNIQGNFFRALNLPQPAPPALLF